MSWLCSCGLINVGLNAACAGSKYFSSAKHYQISVNQPDEVEAAIVAWEFRMTEQEALYAQFYNHEKLSVAGMTDVQLQEHYTALQTIAFEAKTRQIAAHDELKERKAKSLNTKEWLTSTTETPASESINTVRARSARMSKMDKIKQSLEKAGLDDETIKEMVANLSARATDRQVQAFQTVKKAAETKEVTAPFTKSAEPSEPFDLNRFFPKGD